MLVISQKIEYNMGNTKLKSKREGMEPPTDQEIAVVKKRLDEVKSEVEEEEEFLSEEVSEDEQEEPKGLMARRQ